MMSEMAVEDAPPLIAEIDTDVAEGRLADAAASAHSLKGTLSTFESGSPVKELQLMIDAARAAQVDEAARRQQSRVAVQSLLSEIEALNTNG